MYRYGIFQGGGVKGIALVGALEAVENKKINFEGVGGASAGAIVAALYASGYTTSEMKLIFENIDFETLLDSSGWAPWALYKKQGIYRGHKFQNWIYGLLKKKNVRFFKDCKKELRIVATDLTARNLVILDRHNHPQMEVADAIRMSMSLPFVFEPKKIGEHLIVDGGVLSNFPLSLFDANETLGFRLRANSNNMSFAPDGIRSYVVGLVGAMLDGRDNYDIEAKALKGLIEIDPGDISTTQFKLNQKQKDDLYESGLSAANKFFLAPNNATKSAERTIGSSAKNITLSIPDGLREDTEIRFSISALVRVESQGQLLLVKGSRINQYQPVGGVLKVYANTKTALAKIGVKNDSKFPIDSDSVDDLRVFVPWRSVGEFLKWYLQGIGRETSPWREFYEELLEPQILSQSNFRTPAFDHIGTWVEGIRWSPHFSCYEVLIAEIFSIVPTPQQQIELDDLRSKGIRNELMWASPALIRALGYDSSSRSQITQISEHSSWLLDVDPHNQTLI